MAAIPAGGSLVATHDYYRRRLGSASGSSACGGADCAGGAAPQRPGESRRRHPAAEPGPWWAGLFGRPALASTAPALESPGRTTPKRKLRESRSSLSKPHASLPDPLELCASHQVENKLQAAGGLGGVREPGAGSREPCAPPGLGLKSRTLVSLTSWRGEELALLPGPSRGPSLGSPLPGPAQAQADKLLPQVWGLGS
uniref:pancreatic progenitor cell differentiation and proliferation factor isoform X2 n=1 Tax=Nyctereutes procyonoides TaxID=34880 RepID=UPI002444EE40|nr:pancreatic progenitor cell differentiation and proliferation factor isoform X2 [Nyctereutes procyonoides]